MQDAISNEIAINDLVDLDKLKYLINDFFNLYNISEFIFKRNFLISKMLILSLTNKFQLKNYL